MSGRVVQIGPFRGRQMPYWDGPDRWVFNPAPLIVYESAEDRSVPIPIPPEAEGRRILRFEHDVLWTRAVIVFESRGTPEETPR